MTSPGCMHEVEKLAKSAWGVHECQINMDYAKPAITNMLAELAETMNRKERKV